MIEKRQTNYSKNTDNIHGSYYNNTHYSDKKSTTKL